METTTLRTEHSEVVRNRLSQLREKRKQCMSANSADRAAELRKQKDRSAEYRNMSKATDSEPASESRDEEDRLSWTAYQWEAYEKSKTRASLRSGYKSHFDLAHSTYLKEISRKPADKEKYKRVAESENLMFQVNLAKDDVEELAQSLQAASERRLKRRRTQDSRDDFITEKNKQFNMKLDRDYGKEED